MCTAVTYQTKDFYFGRTLDYEHGFSQQVAVMPRNFPLSFRSRGISLEHHHAIIGMAYVAQGYPLYFDAVNEKGLAMAGLNFVGYAKYREPTQGKDNVATKPEANEKQGASAPCFVSPYFPDTFLPVPRRWRRRQRR